MNTPIQFSERIHLANQGNAQQLLPPQFPSPGGQMPEIGAIKAPGFRPDKYFSKGDFKKMPKPGHGYNPKRDGPLL